MNTFFKLQTNETVYLQHFDHTTRQCHHTTPHNPEYLNKSEGFSFNSKHELGLEDLFAGVEGNVEPRYAGVCRGQVAVVGGAYGDCWHGLEPLLAGRQSRARGPKVYLKWQGGNGDRLIHIPTRLILTQGVGANYLNFPKGKSIDQTAYLSAAPFHNFHRDNG